MSAESGVAPEAETSLLRHMVESMEESIECLEEQDAEGAVDAISGMTDGAECSVCIGIETELLGLLTALRATPGGRKGRIAEFTIEEMEHYTSKLKEGY